MNPSLRSRYFGWLLLLLLFNYMLLLATITSIELHEAHSEQTPFRNEIPEIVTFLGVLSASVPVVLLIAWRIAGRLLRPLNQVVTTAEHIRQGHLTERIPPLPHNDELARLADTINEAFDRYAAAVRRLEHFSADASHQLRTPLTAIRGAADVALQAERSADEYRETLGEILEQTARLNETVEQLLALSRLDRSMRDTFQPLALAPLVRQWMAEAREAMDGVQLTSAIDVPDELRLRGNAILLHEVFSNLVDNAYAFMPDGGALHVALLQPAEDRLVWRIEDAGPGIPEEDRERVFDRFFRGRQSTHQGSGLGLAIVREIVLLHGGLIRAERSERLGGAAMVIEFPVG
jgi:signal transduction histidine kinase